MKDYSCYLFDADGTLIDTNELIYRCFVFTCKKYGDMDISRDLATRNIGLTLRRQMETYLGPLSDEEFTAIADDHMHYQLSIYRHYLRLFPSVQEGLRVLHAKGKQCGVVTSRRMVTLELYLRETGIFDLFQVFVTPENTAKHKPEPDPVLEALSLFKITDKESVLMIGDSDFDIECGFRAGIDTAFVAWSHNDPLTLKTKPTHIIDDFMQLCSAPE